MVHLVSFWKQTALINLVWITIRFFWEWYTSTNCRLVVWVGGLDYGIPLWKGWLLWDTLRIPNHRAPNHQLTISWIQPPNFNNSPRILKGKGQNSDLETYHFFWRANCQTAGGFHSTKLNAATPKIAKFWKEIQSHQTKKPIIFLGPEGGVSNHSVRFPIISTRHWVGPTIHQHQVPRQSMASMDLRLQYALEEVRSSLFVA